MKVKPAWSVLKRTFASFSVDKVPQLSAALAYYALFSIGPLLVLIIGIAGFILGGQQDVQQEVLAKVEGSVGPKAASVVQSMMGAQHRGGSLLAMILGGVGLILGASGLFAQLQDSLNTIWGVQSKPGMGIWGFLLKRVTALSMILGIGFLLLLSMVLTSLVGGMSQYIGELISVPGWVIWVLNGALSLAVITTLFALMFKYLPDVKVQWGDVWAGAFATTVLFLIGQFVLGWYLGRQSTTSAYGAAGSVVVILLYIYYSSLILFVGAEFTKAYAYERGSKVVPDKHAVFVTEEDRAQQGRPTPERVEGATRDRDKPGDDSQQLPKAA